MCATRSCTTNGWSTRCRRAARCSWRNCPRCRPAASPSSAPMASPRRWRPRRKERDLHVLNATCPLVTKVHSQGRHYVRKGRSVILIGHVGHPEVEGTLGQIPGPVHVVQSEADVAALDIAARHPDRLCDPDHALRRRHPRHHPGAPPPLYRRGGAGHPGYLLRDTKSPDRAARAQPAGGCDFRGRRNK